MSSSVGMILANIWKNKKCSKLQPVIAIIVPNFVSFSINRTIVMTITIIVEEKIYIAIIKIIITIVLVIIVLL